MPEEQRPEVPRISEIVSPPEETKEDKKAIEEYYEDIEKDEKRQSHHRRQTRKKVLQWLILGVLFFLVICAAIVFSIRMWHALAVQRLCWIDQDRLNDLDTLGKWVVTGALGGLLTKFVENNVTS